VSSDESLSYEFMAEVVDDPEPGAPTVLFRYVIDAAVEVALRTEWWESLGKPDVIQVRVTADDQP
jgi:hypothetical protein